MSVATGSIYYETDIDTESENLSGTLTDSGILSIEGAFEEEINGDNAFRYPSVIYNLQQVQNTGLFFLLSPEAAVRGQRRTFRPLNPVTGAVSRHQSRTTSYCSWL